MKTFDFIQHICASNVSRTHMVAAMPTTSVMADRNSQDKPI
ncbi:MULTISPECIES: hypothetical protein [Vibrio]|nr:MULTISPECIES: hypothetical protein [Vibrio]